MVSDIAFPLKGISIIIFLETFVKGQICMANFHLVILKRPYLDLILEGKKTVESRFLKVRKEPLGKVSVGDVLFLKESSGPVCGRATVAAVKFFEDLSPEKIKKIKAQYNHLIGGSEEYWQGKRECKFGVFVWLKDIQKVKPIWIDKRDWRGWVVLTGRQNFGLFKSACR
jgi:ASC-1-like (ASCH) protein